MRVATIAILSVTLLASASWAEPPASAPAPATQAAVDDPPASTPKETLRSLNLALRDGQSGAIRSLFVTRDQRGADLVSAMADYAAALVILHEAAEKAYGKEGANTVTGDIRAQSEEGLAAIDRAEELITGDVAQVRYTNANDAPVKLIRIDDRWKLPLSQMIEGVDHAAQRRRYEELTTQAALAKKTAEELRAGKYKEGPLKAAEVWRSRLLEPIDGPATKAD